MHKRTLRNPRSYALPMMAPAASADDTRAVFRAIQDALHEASRVVVVGGGPTAVEAAGEEQGTRSGAGGGGCAQRSCKRPPLMSSRPASILPSHCRSAEIKVARGAAVSVTLLHSGPRLLSSAASGTGGSGGDGGENFPAEFHRALDAKLAAIGVEARRGRAGFS